MSQLEPKQCQWFRRQLRAWAKVHLRDFPWRRTRDPYAIFIAEFCLQKTSAASALPVYEAFLARYPSLADLGAADPNDVAALLQPLGLFFRAERLRDAARLLLEKHGGKIPNDEAKLLALPGVGKYTARAVLASAFGRRSPVLDTNVARILERFFGIRGERVKSRCKILWAAAEEVAPNRDVSTWNLTLLDLGAGVCTAKNPRCEVCPLQKRCCHKATALPIQISAKTAARSP